jgi:hypothetical protein
MADHPLNLALRFALEIAALAALSLWGWRREPGLTRYLLALGLPFLAGTIWSVLRVPEDGPRAPIAVPGPLRLALELALFACALWALFNTGEAALAWIFAAAIALHYLLSYDRVQRLLGR